MKKNTFNLTLLTGIFCLGLITSNLFGGKLISVLGLTVAGAIVTYPLTFLTTDIIGEIWGKKEANDCVKVGIIVQIGFLILGYLSLKIPTLSQTTHLQECLTAVLNQGTRMTFASLGAFAVSQTMDRSAPMPDSVATFWRAWEFGACIGAMRACSAMWPRWWSVRAA